MVLTQSRGFVLQPFSISFLMVECKRERYRSIFAGSSSTTIFREISRTLLKSNTRLSPFRDCWLIPRGIPAEEYGIVWRMMPCKQYFVCALQRVCSLPWLDARSFVRDLPSSPYQWSPRREGSCSQFPIVGLAIAGGHRF